MPCIFIFFTMDDSFWVEVPKEIYSLTARWNAGVHWILSPHITFFLLLPYNRKSDPVSWESLQRWDLSNETQGHLHLLLSSQVCIVWKLCQLWRLQVVWGQPFWQCTPGLCQNAAVGVSQWLAGKCCCALGVFMWEVKRQHHRPTVVTAKPRDPNTTTFGDQCNILALDLTSSAQQWWWFI